MRDPYDVLGVPRKASDAEIKKAFRALAKKHHPDTHGNDPAKVKTFQEISAAYELLGDKEKRAQYDRGEIDANGQPKGFNPGAHGFEQGFGGFGGGPGGPGAGPGAGASGFRWSGNAGGPEGFKAEDIFSDLFGGAFGGAARGGRRTQAPVKGADLQFTATISFEEAMKGGARRVPLADGRQVEAKIPPGVKEGQQIRLKGQGSPSPNGGPPGDALITISIAPHPYFTRDGQDLKLDVPVTLKEAVLGGKIEVPTPTGPVALTLPPKSNSGKVLRLKGKGMPGVGGEAAGDLYVRLIVTLPDSPDAKLEAYAKSAPDYDPRSRLK